MLNAMTVDVEDYFHVEAFRPWAPKESWPSFRPRVGRNTERLLSLFDKHSVRATFFVLGWVAERYPALVRRIQKAGHEIGCHSHAHEPISRMTPDEFRADLRRSLAVLSDITGEPVAGFRAPTFSVVRSTLWALDILVEQLLVYDSSIFPVPHDRYGIPDFYRFLTPLLQNGKTLWEFPPTTLRLLNTNLPVGGGGYLRLFPTRLIEWGLAQAHRHQAPGLMYIHPWEIDPDQPRMNGPLLRRWRHSINLSKVESKLVNLMGKYRFGAAIDAIREWQAGGRSSVLSLETPLNRRSNDPLERQPYDGDASARKGECGDS